MKLKRIKGIHYVTIDGVVIAFDSLNDALEFIWVNR